jgi:hypothetical protein
VVLPIPKVAVLMKFSDYRPISLLASLSKVFEVLYARQMEAHIQRNELLTVFQSRFRRHHSTTAAILKVTEDICLNMEDGQVTVLELLVFCQAFDMVIHGLLLCKLRSLQNYLDGARMLVDGGLVSEWEDPVCEMRLKGVFCWEGDVWCSAEVGSWSTIIYFLY